MTSVLPGPPTPPSGPPPAAPTGPPPGPLAGSFEVEPGEPRSGLSRGAKVGIAIVVGGILVVVGLIVALVLWVRSNADEANRLVPLAAEVGDCVAVAGGDSSIVSCDQVHAYEVYLEFEWTGSGYPGIFERIGAEGDRCERALEDFVGSDYFDSRFDYEIVVGSEAQWKAGNRTAKCVLYDLFDRSFAGTAENSHQ